MPFNVINVMLANKEVLISTEKVKFDNKGLGTIESEELYNAVLELKGYFPAEEQAEDKAQAENDESPIKDSIEKPVEDDAKGEDLEKQEEAKEPNFGDMTHDELDAYAKENFEDLSDYPKSGNKKEKMAFLSK